MGLLLVNAAAVLLMTGVIWFVQVVHYPLFAAVGPDAWDGYHRAHSTRTTWVVVGPMTVDLVTSLALVVVRPDAVPLAATLAGAALTGATWLVTGLLAVPAHTRLGRGWDAAIGTRLVHVNAIRTAAWTAHAALVVGMLAAAA